MVGNVAGGLIFLGLTLYFTHARPGRPRREASGTLTPTPAKVEQLA